MRERSIGTRLGILCQVQWENENTQTGRNMTANAVSCTVVITQHLEGTG